MRLHFFVCAFQGALRKGEGEYEDHECTCEQIVREYEETRKEEWDEIIKEACRDLRKS